MESSKTDSSGPPMDMDVDESNEEPRSEPTPEVEGLKPEKENESNEKSPCESTATKEEVDSNEKLHSEPKVEESQKAEKEDESERNEKPPCEPSVAGFKPEEVDEDEGLADEFPVFSGKKRSARAKKLSSRKKMKIEIKIQTKMDEVEALFDEKYYGTTPFQSEIVPEDMAGTITQLEIDELNEKQVEEMLQFYEQTHEEQLPEVIAFNNQKHRLQCNKELEKLAKEDEQGRKEIAVIINEQLKEKQSSADRNIERLRNKAASEEQKDMQKLLQLYNEKAASNQNKIQNGIKLLTKRHQQEMQKQANQHHQVAQSQRMPEPMANAVWSRESQRLQVKYQRQLQEFNAKGEDVKKKCESDYAREREKRRKHHAKRKQDMEHGMQKVISRMHQNFHQQHQRYVKRHMQRLKKRRDEIVARMNGEAFPKRENKSKSQKDFLATDKENRVKLRAPSPIKSMVVEGQDPSDSNKAAAARHKHRKAILSTIPKQLAVEIHNEGLWISMIVPESKDDGKSRHDDKEKRKDDKSKDSEFIPWGLEARRVLHTVVCGEIPLGYDHNRFDFGDILTQQGGHIRCVVTDLRTGVDTASLQRAESIKEQEEDTVRELEKKANTFQQLMNEADKALNRAEGAEKDAIQACEKTQKDLEKAKKLLHDFKQKFGRFFGPGRLNYRNSLSSDTFLGSSIIYILTFFFKTAGQFQTRHRKKISEGCWMHHADTRLTWLPQRSGKRQRDKHLLTPRVTHRNAITKSNKRKSHLLQLRHFFERERP